MPFKLPKNPDAIPKNARKINVGDICYVCGGSTKVKVIAKAETFQPECEILELHPTNPTWRYKVGEKHRIPRTDLYTRKGNSKRA
jgi:hypothetical protein